MAKIPIILEPGRADGKLIKSNSVYDDNQEKFLSDKLEEIDNNHNTLNNIVNSLADEEDITRNTDGKLQFKNKESGDGMGYVILRKNKSFAEQAIKENTIYEIRYDFDLNSEEITIPDNCILKFEGGSLKNGTLVGVERIQNSNSGCLEHIKFIGGYKNNFSANLDWFIKKYPINADDTSIDNTEEIIDAINSGVGTIIIPYKYLHVTHTIFVNRCMNFEFEGNTADYDTTFSASNDISAIIKPCIFSKNTITIFNFKITESSELSRVNTSIHLGAFSIYINVKYTDNSNEEVPIINIENQTTSTIWGITLDCNISSKCYTYTINGKGDKFLSYTGIKIKAVTKAISYVRINGNIYGVYRGIDCSHGDNTWFTDVFIYGNTWCCYGGRFIDVHPVIIYGSHQTNVIDHTDPTRSEAYFTGTTIRAYGYVWDCYTKSKFSEFYTVAQPYNISNTIYSNIPKPLHNIYGYNIYPKEGTQVVDLYNYNSVHNNLLHKCLKPSHPEITNFSYTLNGESIFTNTTNIINIDNLWNDRTIKGRNFIETQYTNTCRFINLNSNKEDIIEIRITLNKNRLFSYYEGGLPFIMFYNVLNNNVTYDLKITSGENIILEKLGQDGDFYSSRIKAIKLLPDSTTMPGDTIDIYLKITVPVDIIFAVAPTLVILSSDRTDTTLVTSKNVSFPKVNTERKGLMVYDDTKKMPFWWNGATWVDSTNCLPTEVSSSARGIKVNTTSNTKILKIVLNGKTDFFGFISYGQFDSPYTLAITLSTTIGSNSGFPNILNLSEIFIGTNNNCSAIAYNHNGNNVIEITYKLTNYKNAYILYATSNVLSVEQVSTSGYTENESTNKIIGLKTNLPYKYCNADNRPIDAANGYICYDTTLNKLISKINSGWIDMNGHSAVNSKGTSRPTLNSTTDIGFQYFDTTLNKPIWWTGTKWVDSTGADI